MSKRAERRHHRERILKRKREIAKRWSGGVGHWIQKHDWHIGPCLDPEGRIKHMKYVEFTARKLLGHNKCPCGMCKRPRYNRIAVRRGRPNNY